MVTVTQFLEGGTFVGKRPISTLGEPKFAMITIVLTKTEQNNVYRVDYAHREDAHLFIQIVKIIGSNIYYKSSPYIDKSVITDVNGIVWDKSHYKHCVPVDVNHVITEAEYLEHLENLKNK